MGAQTTEDMGENLILFLLSTVHLKNINVQLPINTYMTRQQFKIIFFRPIVETYCGELILTLCHSTNVGCRK